MAIWTWRADSSIAPLKPANCGFAVGWSETFRTRFEGQPLKGVALSFAGRMVRGEAVITASGLEGGAVYAISAPLRDAVLKNGEATLHVALRPDAEPSEIAARLGCDQNPLDVGNDADRIRLLSYLWPDQFDRARRLRGA